MTEPNEGESEDRTLPAGPDEAPDTKETDSYTNAPTYSESPGDTDEDAPASPAVDTLSLYLRNIGAHPILKRDEEHTLAIAASEGDEEALTYWFVRISDMSSPWRIATKASGFHSKI